MNHTQGKVKYQEESDAYTHIIRGDGGRMIAYAPQGSNGTDEANARRLVACWNACEGIPTEWLESVSQEITVRSFGETIQQRDELKAENEKLREAIQNFLDTCEATNPLINGPTFVAIDALHAVMEGK